MPRRSSEVRGQVVELCQRQGLSHETAASVLGISSTTVGRYLRDSEVPARWEALSDAALEARRDLVVELYALGESERAIGAQLGWSYETIRRDLRIKKVPRRPHVNGLLRWNDEHDLRDPDRLLVLDRGCRHFRAKVKRVKRERGLIDTAELLKRLRAAGVPRSKESIRWRVEAGLLEREQDLPFDRPWLFTLAAADALIAQLREDERYARWNERKYRMAQIASQFGSDAAGREGGWWTLDSPRSRAARAYDRGVKELWASDLTHTEIAAQLGISDRYVRQIARRCELPPRRPGPKVRTQLRNNPPG